MLRATLSSMNIPNPPRSEVSIWADDLKSGALPAICVKSGRPTTGTIRIQFSKTDGAALAGLIPGLTSSESGRFPVVRGRMPITVGWSLAISATRLIVIAAAVGIGYGLWQLVTTPKPSLTAVGILIAGNAILLIWNSVRGWLEPTGVIYRTPNGRTWVRVRGVHPNFAAAMTGSSVEEVTLSAPAPAKRLVPAWLMWTVLLILWAVIGIEAWTRFHG
jgi:hypothetical protein